MLLKLPAAAIALLLSLAAPLAADPARHPDSIKQPPKDGCERDPGGLIAGTSPQWAYVNKSHRPRYLRGVARNARPTETDLFRAHDSYDMNVFFHPNARYANYLGTANIRKPKTQDKDERNTMELEWEQRAYKLFAWPTAGDRVEVMGSWIWDCGHWGPQDFNDPNYFEPGTQPGEKVTGERTEIHSPRMMIVHRRWPSTSARGDAVTDAFISSEGTFARGVEQHTAGYCDQPEDVCSQWVPVNDRNYSFVAKAPPRPNGARRLRWRIIDHGSTNAPEPRVTPGRGGIKVTVPFKGWGKRGDKMVFAKEIRVGWDVPRRTQHLRVRLLHLRWAVELDGAQPFTCVPEQPCTGEPQDSQPPDEVNVYIDVAGQWRQLKVPGLMSAAPGDKFDLSDTFDVYVSPKSRWRVLGRGRECDQPKLKECNAPQEAGLNEDAGIFDDRYVGARHVAGRHLAMGTSEACDVDAQSPCYWLLYRIDKVRRERSVSGSR